jgi:hypothetical protein
MMAIITAIFGAYDYSAPEVLSYMEGGMSKPALSVAAIMSAAVSSAPAQQLSPNGVKTLAPAGAIKPTGTWDLGTRPGDFIFIAGMRGIDPKTDTLVEGDEAANSPGLLEYEAHCRVGGRDLARRRPARSVRDRYVSLPSAGE